MKLKKKNLSQQSRSEKISLPGDVAELLDEYAKYYLNTYREPIPTNELIVEMLSVFMKSDRDFMKTLKNEMHLIPAEPDKKELS
jgi:hypothetical protein